LAAGLRNFTRLSVDIDREGDTDITQTGERGNMDLRREGSTSSNASQLVPADGERVGPKHGMWSVELAMGYPWTIRSPVNYSGSVILHFTDTMDSGTIHAVTHTGQEYYDEDEAGVRHRTETKNQKDAEDTISKNLRRHSRGKTVVGILIFFMLAVILIFTRLTPGICNPWSQSTRRQVCRFLAVIFSRCECVRVLFTRNWYGFFGSRSTPQKSAERDDDEESTDRNLLTLNTRHNSITTLNSITSHVNLSFNDRNNNNVWKSRSTSGSSLREDRLDRIDGGERGRRGDLIVTEVYDRLYQNDSDEDSAESIQKSISFVSISSNASSGSSPRKKYITWGTSTHLSAPIFTRLVNESSSVQSRSTNSSDGGYGSVNSLSSVDS
jgi:hypothetical protein